MYISESKSDKLSTAVLTFFTFGYLASSYVLITFSWGRYVMLAMVVCLALFSAMKNRWKITLRFDSFAQWELFFVAFCFLSVIWATDRSHALSMSITLFEIGVCTYLIDISLPNGKKSDILLHALMWSGYAEAIFLLVYLGTQELALLANENSRLSAEIGNPNFIGMVMAVNIVVTLYDLLKDKFKVYHLIAILSVVVLAVTQSRTALFGCVFGVVLILVFAVIKGRITIKSTIQTVAIIAGMVVAFFVLRKVDIFSSVFKRVESFFAVFEGGTADNSTNVRLEMIAEGFKQFLRTPIGGIGINNGFNVALETVGHDYYLHCNYVELLVGVGSIGFVLYYWVFVKILKRSLKEKLFSPDLTKKKLAFVLIAMILLMDIGTVSYYMKELSFYVLLSLSLIAEKEDKYDIA